MIGQRSFIALALATVLSTSGTRLSAIAIPWLVLTMTGSPVLTGLVGFAEMLPYVLAKALGGPLIDRIGARRISVWCDGLSTLAVALVPLLFWLGLLSIWALLPAVALIGVLRAPADAAKQALVPSVAAMGKLPLERVTGVMGASDRLAGTLGAAGAGLLIAVLGPAPALLANALAFVLSAIVVAFGIPAQHGAVPARDRTSRYHTELAAGWTVLSSDPVLRGLVLMIAVTNLFDQAYAIVLLPVWVQTSGLDVTWVGIFLAAFSGASIAGAAIAAIIGHRLPRLAVYTTGFLFAGPFPMLVFAIDAPVPAILTVLVVSGFSAGFLNPIIGAILFERIPSPMVGRVIALFGALAWSLMPFGGLYAGLVVDNFGIAIALGATAVLYLLATMTPLAVPSFRQMNRRPLVPA
ncbi:MAG: MFS transporter [Alphaproteobacteria bacterium]|nr:MFS transporter [Alphaproteobacteria bacterium]MBU1561404.1 MFS transporter [Alphaproteobacteria bacterium]MBU2302524.1 MFS transporter [Alphaproteobacteria bacterium]MBU2367512.1 MFS transporter [Alphaproteobacteria bacterium]